MAGTTTKSHDNQGLAGGTMRDLLIQYNAAVTDLGNVLQAVSSVALNSGGLAIFGAGSTAVKTVNTITAILMPVGGGQPVFSQFAPATLAALIGTVLNGDWGVWTFAWDGVTQTTSALSGGAVSTLAAVPLPTITPEKAVLGSLIIHPTGAGNFGGGSTALDDASVVPNAVYINFTGSPILSAVQTNAGLTAAKVGNMGGTAFTT